ncbi:oxidoreductase [Actinomadura sp. NBRC 104412]|uniref:SDR family NAD(P)-dependent oxidoreductase n=1 Tax=Actinomadura sp. NBRC 104412 TaxID=3032203 RepID=UPI0024A307C9|nr:SDR family NAD(P)-dependent oxidoreductase [Actinomadura sp. NBRC 104412]GLZ06180.1 oxidoreductase [Actinomadura sp. NBRC 104412]
MPERFADRVVLVTGAAQGIGESVAVRLASEGARVALLDLPGSPVSDVAARIDAAGERARPYELDVTDTAALNTCVAKVAEDWGRIDGLVNNAGINGPSAPVEEYPEDEFDRVVAVNLKAVWLGTKAVFPHLKRVGGAIVNLASTAGTAGYPGRAPYSAAKHAVIGLTKATAVEGAPFGVRVNCVCPSGVETPMMLDAERAAGGDAARAREAFLASKPLGRYARPEEIAALIAFLLSPEAGYITGAPYLIDGGQTARP